MLSLPLVVDETANFLTSLPCVHSLAHSHLRCAYHLSFHLSFSLYDTATSSVQLFEEALQLDDPEPYIFGAFAIFLVLVVATEQAVARGKSLFSRALRLERTGKRQRGVSLRWILMLSSLQSISR